MRAQLLQSPAVRAAIAILLLTPMPAAAQDVTEPALKAAFIYNFAKFTEWPADVMPAGEPLLFCVLGDAAIGEALARAVKGRTLAGHIMEVSQSAPDGPPRGGCHVLYLSGVTASQAATLVAGLRDAPVLTISDVEGFTQLGGIAQFFFEHGQLRFNVHARVGQARSTPDQLETAGVGQDKMTVSTRTPCRPAEKESCDARSILRSSSFGTLIRWGGLQPSGPDSDRSRSAAA